VWGHRYVSESVLKTVVSELRSALSDDAKQPRYIETVSRRGYRFISGVGQDEEKPKTDLVVAPIGIEKPIVPRISVPLMIGRQRVLAQLSAAWTNASHGRRQIFWIVGEAGVGKTTLIDNFAAALVGVQCVYGQCVEQYGTSEPYLPVLEALGSLCRRDPALVQLMRSVAPTWLLQLPWLGSGPERETLRRELTGIGQERMLRELAELLDQYTEREPLVLVTEDLHWSDHATVSLINAVARRRTAARLLWIGSFRPAELISEEHPLNGVRHELRAHRLCEEIVLDSFSEREVADYVNHRFPGMGFAEPFVLSLHAHTDGLPLFVVNVVDDLEAQGALRADSEFMGATPPQLRWRVPESLTGTIEKQLAQLGAETRSVLDAASICGMEFRAAAVASVLGQSAPWVAAQCDKLIRQRYWLRHVSLGDRLDGTLDALYIFHHALYRGVLYERLSPLVRVEWHRQLASAMERTPELQASAAEIASHYERGLEPVAAVRHYVRAADEALSRFAPTEVLSLGTHALSLLPKPMHQSDDLLLELALQSRRGIAGAQLYGVTSPQVTQALERGQVLCEKLPRPLERAWMLSGLGWVLYTRGDYAAARAHAERIETLALNDDDPLLLACACCLRGVSLACQGELQPARHWLERGVGIGTELGDRLTSVPLTIDLLVVMTANLCVLLQHLGFPDRARTRLQQSLDRAQAIGQLNARELAHRCAAVLMEQMGDYSAAAEHARLLGELVDKHAFAQGTGPSRWMCGIALARRGEPLAGCELILEGLRYNHQLGMYYGSTRVLGYAAEAMMLANDWQTAQEHIDQALAWAQRLGERMLLPDLLRQHSRIAHHHGDDEAAREALRESLREARAQQALSSQLAALTALCELENAVPEDFVALKRAHETISEGFDTALVKRANELLDRGRALRGQGTHTERSGHRKYY
jgi:tetratricopeptide (TPR) repeat protein